MHPMAEFLLKALAVVATATLAYLAALFAVSRHRKRCPACGSKTLRYVQYIRATVLIDGGRAPDSWTYFECETCRSRQKQHRGTFSVVDDEEWQRYCQRRKA